MKRNRRPKQTRNQISDLGLLITQAKVNVSLREPQAPAALRAKSSPGFRGSRETRPSPVRSQTPSELDRNETPKRSPFLPRSGSAYRASLSNSLEKKPRSPSRARHDSFVSSTESLHDRPRSSRRDLYYDNQLPYKPATDKVNIWKGSNGSLVAQRNPKDKTADPERLILENYNLSSCPSLSSEENVCLLSLKNNNIREIKNLESLKRLVYLDFSDNSLDVISGLDALRNLRVLIVSNNRLKMISGLESLTLLDILDLSGNQIRTIENLCHLKELRVLNLSSNALTNTDGIENMASLVDLNLSHNFISRVENLENLQNLQKLNLEDNRIEYVSDIWAILTIVRLQELSLSSCLVSQDPNYRQVILSSLLNLKTLDSKRISEEERRAAVALHKKEEQRKLEFERLSKLKEARNKALKKVQEEWQKIVSNGGTCISNSSEAAATKLSDSFHNLRLSQNKIPAIAPPLMPRVNSAAASTASPRFSGLSRSRTLFRNQSQTSIEVEDEDDAGEEDFEDDMWSFRRVESRSLSYSREGSEVGRGARRKNTIPKSASKKTTRKSKLKMKDPTRMEGADEIVTRVESDSNHLVDVEEGRMRLYGHGAVIAVLKQAWRPETTNAIHSITFAFLLFDQISTLLGKLKRIFPRLIDLRFENANISSLCQLNVLAQFSNLESLTVSTSGNPVTDLSLWRDFAIYRLPNTLRTINDEPVTASSRMRAEELFSGLSLEIATRLPKYRLQTFQDPRTQQMCLKERGYASNVIHKHGGVEVPAMTSDTVSKSFLTYVSSSEQSGISTFGAYAQAMCQECLNNVELINRKQTILRTILPKFLHECVSRAMEDYSDPQQYMKTAMKKLCNDDSS